MWNPGTDLPAVGSMPGNGPSSGTGLAGGPLVHRFCRSRDPHPGPDGLGTRPVPPGDGRAFDFAVEKELYVIQARLDIPCIDR